MRTKKISTETKVADYKSDPRLGKEVKESDAQSSFNVDVSGIEITEKPITADGYKVKLHIVRPEGQKEILPVFIFIHGGGWVLGDFHTHKRMVTDLVVLSGAAAVFVNYTPAPS